MRKETYTFDSYYPSGNSCKWLYDSEKRTIFLSDTGFNHWKIRPKFGDKIILIKSSDGLTVLESYVNGELSFKFTKELEDTMYKEQQDSINSEVEACKQRLK